MTVDMFEDHSPDVDITFTKEDLRDVVPRKLGRCNVLANFHAVATTP